MISSSIFDTRVFTWSSPIAILVTTRLAFAERAMARLLTTARPAKGARLSATGRWRALDMRARFGCALGATVALALGEGQGTARTLGLASLG